LTNAVEYGVHKNQRKRGTSVLTFIHELMNKELKKKKRKPIRRIGGKGGRSFQKDKSKCQERQTLTCGEGNQVSGLVENVRRKEKRGGGPDLFYGEGKNLRLIWKRQAIGKKNCSWGEGSMKIQRARGKSWLGTLYCQTRLAYHGFSPKKVPVSEILGRTVAKNRFGKDEGVNQITPPLNR